MSTYECVASVPEGTFDATAEITKDAIVVRVADGSRHVLPFEGLMDMRLLNYHLQLSMRGYDAEICKLGYQTEEFFEKLWQAYSAKSEKSLFVASDLIMRSEGDYSYSEPGIERASIAKLALFTDCLCIVPHDVGARRVPLCFVDSPIREGFKLTLKLDTGETYQIARLGGDTEPLFGKLAEAHERAIASWEAAHRELEANLRARLGDSAAAYDAFEALDADIVHGLFSFDDEAFWFAAITDDRAAVELVTDEKTATYLYRFGASDELGASGTSSEIFTNSLRHAMEAMKMNRRVIYASAEDVAQEPLFLMAIDRSPHVRFLRACNVGRAIHTASWAQKVAEFFA